MCRSRGTRVRGCSAASFSYMPYSPDYRVLHGGLFRWLSCPNYLGEIAEEQFRDYPEERRVLIPGTL